MISPQIISSLFDLVREVFNGNNRKQKNKWMGKLIIAILILTVSICFTALGTVTKELYTAKFSLNICKAKVVELTKLEREVLVLKETNGILIDLINSKLPDKDVELFINGKRLAKPQIKQIIE